MLHLKLKIITLGASIKSLKFFLARPKNEKSPSTDVKIYSVITYLLITDT